jgi:hypothetical protein
MQCRSSYCSCCSLDDAGSSPGRSVHLEGNDTALLMVRGKLDETVGQNERILAWHNIIEKFGRLNLTYDQDYFPALASVARVFSRHASLGNEEPRYLAGLWLHSFAQDILWNSNMIFGYNSPRPAKWRAPSWSWASQLNFVAFPELEGIEIKETVFRAHFDVRDITCTPLGVDSMGQLTSAHALLSCRMISGELAYHVDESAVVPNFRTPKGEIRISIGDGQTNISTCFKSFKIQPDYAIYKEGPHHVPSQSAVFLVSTASKGPVHLEGEESTQLVQHFFMILRMLESIAENDIPTYERIGLIEGICQYSSSSDLDSDPLCRSIVPKSICLY